MNPPMIGIERHFPESGSGVVSWVATFFRHLFGQMVSNCEKQEVDDDISTDTFRLETGGYIYTGKTYWYNI